MEENNPGDEFTFSQEDAEKFIVESIESVLVNQIYSESKVPHWINTICEKVVESLVAQQKPYKYIVNCMIMQRNGAGAMLSASCHWDTVADGLVIHQWPRDKQTKDQTKNTMQAIVTVYALSMLSN